MGLGVVQGVECLPSTQETLGSVLSTTENQVWWHLSIIPALRKQSQEDYEQNYRRNLNYLGFGNCSWGNDVVVINMSAPLNICQEKNF